jgi:hypothetical protein
MEDLEQILPDRVGNLSWKRLILALGAVVVVLLVVCVTLGAVAGVALQSPEESPSLPPWHAQVAEELKEAGVCLTPECMTSAAWIVSNVDRTFDPCDNFYKFACGGWQKKVTLTPDAPDMDVQTLMEKENRDRVRNLLDAPIRRNTERSAERKMKDFFGLCVHEYGRISDGGKELLALIREKIGGWYALDPQGWSSSAWDMERALKAANIELQADALFALNIDHYSSEDRNLPQVFMLFYHTKRKL